MLVHHFIHSNHFPFLLWDYHHLENTKNSKKKPKPPSKTLSDNQLATCDPHSLPFRFQLSFSFLGQSSSSLHEQSYQNPPREGQRPVKFNLSNNPSQTTRLHIDTRHSVWTAPKSECAMIHANHRRTDTKRTRAIATERRRIRKRGVLHLPVLNPSPPNSHLGTSHSRNDLFSPVSRLFLLHDSRGEIYWVCIRKQCFSESFFSLSFLSLLRFYVWMSVFQI